MAGLVRLLDPQVWGAVDLGPDDPRSGVVVRGSQPVATNVLRFFGRATLASNPVGRHTIVLAFVEQKLRAILLLTMTSGLITTINVLADPERIGSLGSELSPAGPEGDR